MRTLGNSSHFARRLGLAAVLTALGASPAASAIGNYTVTDLGVLPGGGFSSGLSINSAGDVAGASDAQDSQGFNKRGFLSQDGFMMNLGLPPVSSVLFSVATAVNDGGRVVVNGSNGAFHAFTWEDGGYTDLTTISDVIYSEGRRINDGGQVVGSITLELPGNNFPHHAFLHDGSQMIDLNPLFGGNYSDASDINDAGAVVGQARFAGSSVIRGYVLQNGVVTDISPAPGITSDATAINESGQVAGGAYFDGVHEHPIIYQDGRMTDLGLLPTALGGEAAAINNAGVVVGSCLMPNGKHRAFIVSNGEMSSLSDFIPFDIGWIIEDATDINDAGKIAATARNPQGLRHAIVLMPSVPPVAGDINQDGLVDIDDVFEVVNAWGVCPAPPTTCAADINHDSQVDVDDLFEVINGWTM